MLCQASLLGAARVSLCRARPAESRAGRDPLSQPRLASRGLRAAPSLVTREDTSRGACTRERVHACRCSVPVPRAR
jgi:hypothetical protein